MQSKTKMSERNDYRIYIVSDHLKLSLSKNFQVFSWSSIVWFIHFLFSSSSTSTLSVMIYHIRFSSLKAFFFLLTMITRRYLDQSLVNFLDLFSSSSDIDVLKEKETQSSIYMHIEMCGQGKCLICHVQFAISLFLLLFLFIVYK